MQFGSYISVFRRRINEKAFAGKFGTIQGESVEKAPADLKEIVEREPFILNKQWYFVAEQEPELNLQPELTGEIMAYYLTANR